MADFSWTDGVQAAFSSCLVCFHSSPDSEIEEQPRNSRSYPRNSHLANAIPPPRARPDELEGLLADANADTMSLHSHLGDASRRRKRRRARKGIRVFGYDLFGRPPIHLSEDEDDALHRARTISSSTLDSDASPLDPSSIDELTAARQAATAAAAAAEEERRKAKDERRALRKERKQLRRAAMEMGLTLQQAEEFEGFPGSGGAAPYRQGTGSASYSGSQPGSPFVDEEFGPFAGGAPRTPEEDDEADAAGADFGAETYARKTRGSSSGGGSDSRSRTSGSASNSNANPYVVYNHHQLTQQPSPLSPTPTHARRKSRAGSSKLSESSHTNPNSNPSLLPTVNHASLANHNLNLNTTVHSHAGLSSPAPSTRSPSVRTPQPVGAFDPPGLVTPPHTDEALDDDGFEQDTVERPPPPAPAVSGFPSVGLRGPGIQRTKSDMGAFLANRGET